MRTPLLKGAHGRQQIASWFEVIFHVRGQTFYEVPIAGLIGEYKAYT
ncbi:hypothetical protein CK3_30870 [butyrate-producing bacterium SS3/4]|nr:hypothetical protein CK3_30870 [butyrate-producing bacterium SS3/4]